MIGLSSKDVYFVDLTSFLGFLLSPSAWLGPSTFVHNYGPVYLVIGPYTVL